MKFNTIEQINDDKLAVEKKWKKLHDMIVASTRKRQTTDRQNEKERKKQFDDLLEAFNAHLRISRPVKLWEKLQTDHEKASKTAWWFFLGGAILFAVVAAVIAFFLGDYISTTFVPPNCISGDEPACSRISAKGPLIISSLLAISTVWLWFLRLQMKVHLSERHLYLDARERKAFAETYLSLLKGGEVSRDHEAVVLQSLFRPTQDGIIKDDGGVDVSIAALLSKTLSK